MERCIKIFGSICALGEQLKQDKKYYQNLGQLERSHFNGQTSIQLSEEREILYAHVNELPEKIRGLRADFVIVDDSVDKVDNEKYLLYLLNCKNV